MSGNDFMMTLKMEDPGQVPVFLRDMTLGMDILNIRTTDVFAENFDSELSARCVTAFREFTGQDAIIGCTHNAAFIVEQFGGRMKYTEYGIPIPLNHPLAQMTDFSSCDTVPKGKMASAIKSYSIARRMNPDTAIVANVTGPLTKAGVLAGVENVAMMIESDTDVLDSLVEKAIENTDNIIEALDRDGSINAGLIAAATDNPDMFGAERFCSVSIPWTKRICGLFGRRGYPVIYHPHGDFTADGADLLAKTLGIGYDGFHYPENNDNRLIASFLRDRKCVLGGTDIVPVLIGDSKKKVIDETISHLETFKDCSYIFMASCSLHRTTPLDNVKTMVDTVRRFN